MSKAVYLSKTATDAQFVDCEIVGGIESHGPRGNFIRTKFFKKDMSSISFNGNVEINGNVEMYDNGSMKITGNDVNVNVSELKSFIEKQLPYSVNKEEYQKAADIISNPPQDKSVIKRAFEKLSEFVKESGKAIWIAGLQGTAQEVAKEIAKHIIK